MVHEGVNTRRQGSLGASLETENHSEAELLAMVQILEAKYYVFPKREPDRGLWEPRGSWDFGLP